MEDLVFLRVFESLNPNLTSEFRNFVIQNGTSKFLKLFDLHETQNA